MAEATAPVAAIPPAATTAATTAPSWIDGLSDDHKAFITTKGYKGTVDLVDAYRNVEKLIGVPQERMLKLPEKSDAPEWSQVWERLGRPKEAKDYDLPTPKGAEKDSEAFASALLKANIPKENAKALMAEVAAYDTAKRTAAAEAAKISAANAENALKKDWGAAFEQNTNMAKEAARALGMAKEQVDAIEMAIGHDKTMKLFHKLSSGIREADFITGSPQGEIATPEQAVSKIKMLKGDRDFTAKYLAGDSVAKATMEGLYKLAYGGEITL